MRRFIEAVRGVDADLAVALAFTAMALCCVAELVWLSDPRGRPRAGLVLVLTTSLGAIAAAGLGALLHLLALLLRRRRRLTRPLTVYRVARHAATGALLGQVVWPLAFVLALARGLPG
ncbi:hypothetical protein [Kitasatospora sp. NPDC059571]|uniref:hypothetical protein n=1 Tax=Kitasatospora sp. NPDC059571 TaxID=3346871 RepID=UPI0036B9621D